MTRLEHSILAHIAEGGEPHQREIYDFTGGDPDTVSAVENLWERGLIARLRSRRFIATDAGLNAIARAA